MPDPRTSYLSAFRGTVSNPGAVQRPDVSSPVGATNSTSVQDNGEAQRKRVAWMSAGSPGEAAAGYQRSVIPSVPAGSQAAALRATGPTPAEVQGAIAAPAAMAAPTASVDASDPWNQVGAEGQGILSGAYGAGGFDAVKQIPNWYDIPTSTRTKLLSRLTAGAGSASEA